MATVPVFQYTNRLAQASSPYLLQHAHNPVDWYPWSEEALQKARSENKPIFLSIGYSACHWCHVMAHESFEDEETAALLNEHFVNIKVDREERPDLDEIYMSAVQITTQNGGWPMSVFLTPELTPFYCGTYFPPQDMYGRPGFRSVLQTLADAWRERRDTITRTADQITDYVQRSAAARLGARTRVSSALLDNAVKELSGVFDGQHGGWGGAPKFPSSSSISLLLRHAWRTGDAQAQHMAVHTLEAMARGGIHDHLGGGFHRYTVDGEWLIPHFEKMLYDNAQLAQAYLEGYQAIRSPLFKTVAEGIFAYVLRDMTAPEGAFYSSEDADSEGREGMFYLWRPKELEEALGHEDAALAARCYTVQASGNFESHEPYHEGTNILHQSRPLEDFANEFHMPLRDLEARLATIRAKLFAVRSQRVRPGLDDKILVSWNALMISALAQGAQVLGNRAYADAATRAARFILTRMRADGVLWRSYRDGTTQQHGFLDDYAFLTVALVDLYETDFDPHWLREADTLTRAMIALFWDEHDGGFFSAPQSQSDLIARLKPVYDGAEPAGNSMAAIALLRLAKYLDNARYAELAEQIIEQNVPNLASAPQATLRSLCAVDLYLHPPVEVAIVGSRGGDDTAHLLGALRERFLPNRVVALFDPDVDDAALRDFVPLLAGKEARGGNATAFVCKNFTCGRPVTTPDALIAALENERRTASR